MHPGSLEPEGGSESERAPVFDLLDARWLEAIRVLDAEPVAFSPCGGQPVPIAADGAVRMQGIEDGVPSDPIPTVMPRQPDLRFSVDSTRIVTHGRADSEIMVWNGGTFDRAANLQGPGLDSSVPWSGDRERMVAASERADT
ncbi:MAG: WD40 repeat domain-containing protein [Phycisphaerales bacterium]|nr:WD40 repeat domain-containing protein [Phycisphaerales bacterium]